MVSVSGLVVDEVHIGLVNVQVLSDMTVEPVLKQPLLICCLTSDEVELYIFQSGYLGHAINLQLIVLSVT